MYIIIRIYIYIYVCVCQASTGIITCHTSSQKKMTRPIPSPHQVSAPVEGLGPKACQGLSQGAHLHVEHMTATSDVWAQGNPGEMSENCRKFWEIGGKYVSKLGESI